MSTTFIPAEQISRVCKEKLNNFMERLAHGQILMVKEAGVLIGKFEHEKVTYHAHLIITKEE